VLAATLAYGDAGRTHPHLVVCAVADERHLAELFERLKLQGVPCVAYYEDDLNNSLTAVATGLLVGEERRPLRRLPLLGRGG
jgi:hypothetical protein